MNLDTVSATDAQFILRAIALARLSTSGQPEPTLPPALRQALSAADWQVGPSPATPQGSGHTGLSPAAPESSEAALARAALALLAADPDFAAPIEQMAAQAARGPLTPPTRYADPATAIAITTAALLALQTAIEYKRDSSGKWSIKITKKSASDSLLKPLIERLLSLLPK